MKYNTKKLIKYIMFVITTFIMLYYIPTNKIYWKDTVSILSGVSVIFVLLDTYIPSIDIEKLENK